jgi:hypothetical protein
MEETMDTKTLVVGQKVYMVSGGCYGNTGEVVKVTPDGVEVRTSPPSLRNLYGMHPATLPTEGELIRFDKDGKETDASRSERLGLDPSESSFHTELWRFAPEAAAWELLTPEEAMARRGIR